MCDICKYTVIKKKIKDEKQDVIESSQIERNGGFMEFAHFNTAQTQYLIPLFFIISDEDMISSLTYFMSLKSV